jgi:amino acid transporter
MIQSDKSSLAVRLRRLLLGAPIATSQAHHERLSPFIGLPVFSSDSLSSVAYATEAILSILVVAAAAVHLQIWISLAIVALIVIIAISYQQTIHAYPSGGGSYIVASENLGETAGLFAGAALLIDYILTVSVSVAGGVVAITSALPALHPYLIPLSLLFTGFVAYANLRGVRESGALFAIPTYGFILAMVAMIAWGGYKAWIGGPVHQQVIADTSQALAPITLFLVLRAFAAGCTALTGIEAVSNGVQAFRAPESKNAAKTLRAMALILSVLFIGIGLIAIRLPVMSLLPTSDRHYTTLASQIAAYSFGNNSVGFYIVQAFTALILILAANTAFADFPRLASLIARDGYLPRYLSRQGDKLVFHNGIVVLAIASSALIVVFKGELDQLLPLYAVGVFTAFTLSQIGMVKHWQRTQEKGWQRSIAINGLGAFLCAIVLGIISYTKFTEGAWLVMVLLPVIYFLFIAIKKRYASMSHQLAVVGDIPQVATEHLTLLLVPRVHRGILSALEYARQLRGETQAIHVTINEKALPELMRQWDRVSEGVPLRVLPSPYRSLIQPILEYVDVLASEHPNMMITVVVAEAVSQKWYHRFLTESVAQQLKYALQRRRNIVVANTRYFLN